MGGGEGLKQGGSFGNVCILPSPPAAPFRDSFQTLLFSEAALPSSTHLQQVVSRASKQPVAVGVPVNLQGGWSQQDYPTMLRPKEELLTPAAPPHLHDPVLVPVQGGSTQGAARFP